MPRLRPAFAIAVGNEVFLSNIRESQELAGVLILRVSIIQPSKPNKQNKPNEPLLLGLRLSGRLCLFPLEFCPAVIEPLRGRAGCIQRLGSFLKRCRV